MKNLQELFGREHGAARLRGMFGFLAARGYQPGSWVQSLFYRLVLPLLGDEPSWLANPAWFLVPGNSIFTLTPPGSEADRGPAAKDYAGGIERRRTLGAGASAAAERGRGGTVRGHG